MHFTGSVRLSAQRRDREDAAGAGADGRRPGASSPPTSTGSTSTVPPTGSSPRRGATTARRSVGSPSTCPPTVSPADAADAPGSATGGAVLPGGRALGGRARRTAGAARARRQAHRAGRARDRGVPELASWRWHARSPASRVASTARSATPTAGCCCGSTAIAPCPLPGPLPDDVRAPLRSRDGMRSQGPIVNEITRLGIVNRGEPAMRLLTAVAELNRDSASPMASEPITTVALYTDPDADAWFVQEADEAIHLGSATYLDPSDGHRKSRYLDEAAVVGALVDGPLRRRLGRLGLRLRARLLRAAVRGGRPRVRRSGQRHHPGARRQGHRQAAGREGRRAGRAVGRRAGRRLPSRPPRRPPRSGTPS